MNIFDRAFTYFAPQVALSRLQSRKAAEQIYNRSFQGGGRGRRLKNWNPRNGDGNSPNVKLLPLLRERARDLENNNEYISAGFNYIADHTVGEGIVADIKGGATQTRLKIEKLWNDHILTPDVDVTGRSGFYSLCHLGAKTLVRDGEFFLVREWREDAPLGFRIKMLESDYLNSERFSTLPSGSDSKNTYYGIEHDEHGRPAAYNFYKNHPGDAHRPGNLLETVRVPASDVIHVFRRDRAHQVRGFPWVAPAMVRAKNLDEYEDTQLERQKIASCFSVFIHDIDGSGLSNQSPLSAAEEYEDLERVEPGIIEKLQPGKTVTFADPPGVENYDEYTTTQLRAIARAIDITYESLVADYSKTNFASGRMGKLLENRRFKVIQQTLLIPNLMHPVSKWFVEGVNLKQPRIKTEDIFFHWLTPVKEMIDPLKEIQAEKLEIRSGLLTFDDALRRRNKDPDKHYSDLKDINAKIDENELELDIDSRKKTQTGLNQQQVDLEKGGSTDED